MSNSVRVSVVLIVALLMGACAGALERSIQVADVEKQVVVAAKDAFAKLYLDDVISRDVYVRGRDAYKKWVVGQTALAESLAEWKRVGNEDSKTRMTAAIAAATRLADVYLKFVGQFIDLPKVRVAVEGGR